MSQDWDAIQYRWHHSEPIKGVAFLKDDRVSLGESTPEDSGMVVSLETIFHRASTHIKIIVK
jgi:hypothetical protein